MPLTPITSCATYLLTNRRSAFSPARAVASMLFTGLYFDQSWVKMPHAGHINYA